MAGSSPTVVHIVWAPLAESLPNFLQHCTAREAGIPHRLVLLFNGFSSRGELARVERSAAGTEYQRLVLKRPVYDLRAYRDAARFVGTGPVCFLNSRAEPLIPGWLELMTRHLTPEVGLVGATGSWESPYTTMLSARPLFQESPRLPPPLPRLREWLTLYRYRRWYPPFPNPHVRTNAFMMRAEDLTSLPEVRLRSKWDCLLLEAGYGSITRGMLGKGKQVVVVGRDGLAYSPEQWDRSGTFRVSGQPNLLVADNRTHGYLDADPDTQRLLERISWGVR